MPQTLESPTIAGIPKSAGPRRKPREIRIGLLGAGSVGQAVIRRCARWRDSDGPLRPVIAAALVRDASRPRGLPPERVTDDAELFFNPEEVYDVVVEVLGGVEPARTLVARALAAGTPVVTANKSLLAAHGDELRALAAASRTSLRCEASVLAGIPLLGTLARRPLVADVRQLSGIVNGTSNFILSAMRRESLTLRDALTKAAELGLAEPNADNDLLGIDACEKLVVLLAHIGAPGARPRQIETAGITRLRPEDLAAAASFGGVIKPVAHASRDDDGVRAFVGPAFLSADHALAAIEREQNAIVLRGDGVGELLFAGPGAGPDVTAVSILDDVIETATGDGSGFRVQKGAQCTLHSSQTTDRGARTTPAPQPSVFDLLPCLTPWFVRFEFRSSPPAPARLAEFLGAHGVWLRRTADVRAGGGVFTIHALTHECWRDRLEEALAQLTAATGGEMFACRVLES